MVVIVEEHVETCDSMVRLIRRATAGLVLGFQDWTDAYNTVVRGDVQALIVSAGDGNAPGAALIRKVRELPNAAKLWVISTSTEVWPETGRAALLGAGADCTLRKPYDINSLLDALAKGLTLTASNDIILLTAGVESQGLDFKERIGLNSADERASIAKDIIAMSNHGGGKIIVGVAEPAPGTFRLVGIDAQELAAYEATVFMKAVRDFMQPQVAVDCRSITYEGRTFKVLSVPASDTVILAARENARSGLFLGRIYSRSPSLESAEIRTASEMRALLDRILSAQAR
jgi:DNA-binding response OmpR family regulator